MDLLFDQCDAIKPKMMWACTQIMRFPYDHILYEIKIQIKKNVYYMWIRTLGHIAPPQKKVTPTTPINFSLYPK
jgi:hypothetical protein